MARTRRVHGPNARSQGRGGSPCASKDLLLRHRKLILHPSPMKTLLPISLGSALLIIGAAESDNGSFHDDFQGKLGEGWSWLREHREAWRVTGLGLEVRVEPGNMWGPANDARNLLIRPAPRPANEGI